MSEAGLAHPHGHVDHFESPERRREAVVFGMWVFLATEIMFFGGLFGVYSVYRFEFHEAFVAGSRRLDLVLGTFNTFLLLTSSLTMVLAVQAAVVDNRRRCSLLLALTMALGAGFLVIKGFEYEHKLHAGLLPVLGLPFAETGPHARGMQLFMSLYVGMTGLHALHMVIGLGLLGWLLTIARSEKSWAARGEAVDIVGLYWHFVDLAWIFLFPLLYLVDRSS